jgi:hypothetical protein
LKTEQFHSVCAQRNIIHGAAVSSLGAAHIICDWSQHRLFVPQGGNDVLALLETILRGARKR